MQRVDLNGASIDYDVRGSGEPLLLIHGSILADAFVALLEEPSIANKYRTITYHRRGFAGSARATPPFTIAQQAADARALLRHLGIARAHVAGHSYGGDIAIQLCLDTPDVVGGLALLEPACINSVPSGAGFLQGLASISAMYERGDRAGATDAFLVAVLGAGYRPLLEKYFPPGAFDLAVADIDTFFQVEVPAGGQWSFTAADAARIRQPVLCLVGDRSEPIFREIHSWLMQTMPHAEELVVPQATHALQYMNPRAVADGLARFFAAHAL